MTSLSIIFFISVLFDIFIKTIILFFIFKILKIESIKYWTPLMIIIFFEVLPFFSIFFLLFFPNPILVSILFPIIFAIMGFILILKKYYKVKWLKIFAAGIIYLLFYFFIIDSEIYLSLIF